MLQDKNQIEEIFNALAEQLKAGGVKDLELVVCGGTALNILGLIFRGTRDVDVVAIVKRDKNGQCVLQIPSVLDEPLKKAAQRIQKDFALEEDWLNVRTAALFTGLGFPQGLLERTSERIFGSNLKIRFLSRYDQIHFKLYAALDSKNRRSAHLGDLLALNPGEKEILEAARWLMTRESGEFYKPALRNFLKQIGFENAAAKL